MCASYMCCGALYLSNSVCSFPYFTLHLAAAAAAAGNTRDSGIYSADPSPNHSAMRHPSDSDAPRSLPASEGHDVSNSRGAPGCGIQRSMSTPAAHVAKRVSSGGKVHVHGFCRVSMVAFSSVVFDLFLPPSSLLFCSGLLCVPVALWPHC